MNNIYVAIFLVISAVLVNTAKADTLNPCEYMNLNVERMNQLDVGDDASFRAQMQYRNRELLTACQEYEIKLLNNARNNIVTGY